MTGTTTVTDAEAVLDHRLLIDGAWVPASSGATFDLINPSTGTLVARMASAGEADVDLAVAAARRALRGPWGLASPVDRQNVLLRLADLVDRHFAELKTLDATDFGSPMGPDPRLGVSAVVETLRYYAGASTKIHGRTVQASQGPLFSFTTKEPVGVVGSIIPWNGPMGNALWKIAPVLATGCAMVLKPAEEACLSILRLGELFREAGIPDGVINIVTGGDTVGRAIVAHPGVDKIAFTGSTVTGQKIMAAAAGTLKRLSLELGGKSPQIVFADADLPRAVAGVAMGALVNSGQACVAGTRLLVQRSAHDEFVQLLRSHVEAMPVGQSLDPRTALGPMVTEDHMSRVLRFVDVGIEEGATVVTGGHRLISGDLDQGFFVPPTIFDNVDDSMTIAQEEIFGPVLSVFVFDDEDEALERANNSAYGLGAGVWTQDLGRALRASARIKSGVVWVNTYLQFDPAMPFGGYKMSGWGRELGPESLDEYLNVKSVWMATD